MIYITILSITILFFVYALILNPITRKILGFKICSICAASSTTWLILLTLRTFNLAEVGDTLLGVLLGGSVVGIMYALLDEFKKRKIKLFWVIRVLWIPWGFYLAYAVAKEDAFMVKIGLAATFTIAVILIFMFKTKKTTKTKKATSDKPTAKREDIDSDKQAAIKKLEASLEDCC